MRILMVSSYLPFPLHSGGRVRLYNLIKELSDNHEIILVCEKRNNQTEEDVKALENFCKKVVAVDRRKQWSLENIAKSGVSSHSFLVTGHTNQKMQQIIAQLLREEKFDVIHVETFYVMQNVMEPGIRNQELGNIPIVLVEHNIEYMVYKRFMGRASLPIRPLLALDIAKIRKEEEAFWKQASKVVAVSEDERKVIERSGVNVSIVPNGVNIEQFAFRSATFRQAQGKAKRILFIGDFKWLQNRDSVEYIIKEIWPQIKLVISNEVRNPTRSLAGIRDDKVKLWIVARNIPNSVRSLTNDPDVLFDEESSARHAHEIFQEADILLSPIRVGGGTSYKILESMSCGTPVVTMPMSANAIAAVDGEHLMVGKVAKELADKTVELLENEKVYKVVAANGRKLIEEHYSWKKIAKELENVYEGVVG